MTTVQLTFNCALPAVAVRPVGCPGGVTVAAGVIEGAGAAASVGVIGAIGVAAVAVGVFDPEAEVLVPPPPHASSSARLKPAMAMENALQRLARSTVRWRSWGLVFSSDTFFSNDEVIFVAIDQFTKVVMLFAWSNLENASPLKAVKGSRSNVAVALVRYGLRASTSDSRE